MHMLFSMLAVLIICVLRAQTKPEWKALIGVMDNNIQKLRKELTHEIKCPTIDKIVEKRIMVFRKAILASFADVFAQTEYQSININIKVKLWYLLMTRVWLACGQASDGPSCSAFIVSRWLLEAKMCALDNETFANDTTTSAAICPNGQMLNYFNENHRPEFCVINRPKDPHYNGKCVNMLDLWNIYNSSRILERDRYGSYYDEYHHRVSVYEYRMWTDEPYYSFDYDLSKTYNVELIISKFATYFSVDEADNTISTLRVLRTLPQCLIEYLGPYSLCKILLDNNIFQFLSLLGESSIQDCPNQVITSPPCTPKKLVIPDGVRYGVKFESGIPTKCQVRSLSSSKCVKVNESIEMLKEFKNDPYYYDSVKVEYSNYRRFIYDGNDHGFSHMLSNNDSVVDAMEKLKNALGLEEYMLVDGTINSQKFEMGAITFCTIFSMHVPFNKTVLLEHSEEC